MGVLETEELRADVQRLTLDRPESLNALNSALRKAIADAVYEANGEYLVLVIEGVGEAFTAGADLNEINETDEDVVIEEFQEMTRAVRAFDGVVIGKIDGWAVGGGFEWTLSFDLRYATTETTFKMTESEVGVTISNASSMLLPLIVGEGVARELIFTSRQLDAMEAHELGLLAGVYEDELALEEKVKSVATDIVENKSPTALELNKRACNSAFPIHEVLDYEAVVNLLCDEWADIQWGDER